MKAYLIHERYHRLIYIPVLILVIFLLVIHSIPPELNNLTISVSSNSQNNLPFTYGRVSGNHIPAALKENPRYSGSVVNPFKRYNSEPAPMGITDFGIGPNGVPYCYNTTSFRGTISLSDLNVTNNGLRGNSSCLGFQLNVVLYFKSGCNTYSFWVQNAVKINTMNHAMTFIDNIWNFTGSIYNMPSDTVLGNGGVINGFLASFYAFEAPVSVEINTSSSLTLQTNVTTCKGGVPELDLMYNLGNGFVTYDQPIFVFTSEVNNPVFRVDGSQYAISNQTFYDASLIMGGPCAGDDIYVHSANISMQLQYWNGWNYQYISNAYNFGANTAEGSSNVIASSYENLNSDFLGSKMVQGNGSLGQIYNSANLSFLHLRVPFQRGSMELNSKFFNFTMGQLNVTLPYITGLQHLKIMNQNKIVYAANISLSPGEYKCLILTNISFREILPPSRSNDNLNWSLDINGTLYNTSSKSLSFCLPSGNYSYSVSYNHEMVPFYNENGTLVLNGTSQTINLYFFEEAYELIFHPTGLTGGTSWRVSVKGIETYYGTFPDSIQIYLPNGTFTFKVGNVHGYNVVSNSSVSLQIDGTGDAFNISFARINTDQFSILQYWYLYALIAGISLSSFVYSYYRKKQI